MMKKILRLFSALLLLAISGHVQAQIPDNVPAGEKALALQQVMPLSFIENKGQLVDAAGKARPDILFTAASGNAQLFLSSTGIHYQFSRIVYPEGYTLSFDPDDAAERSALLSRTKVQAHRFTLQLAGANPNAVIRREHKSITQHNYYLATHPEGITHVAGYEKIVYKNVYPQIDWVVYSHGKNLKYDFVVHPGGDPAQIKLDIRDAGSVRITDQGELLITTSLGEIREKAPQSYADGRAVPSRFVQNNDGTIGFDVAAVPGGTLVIDPVVMWATYYGGTDYDNAQDCNVDAAGNVYVTGYTMSAGNIATSGGFQTIPGGGFDAFLARFDASGTLLWATYYGGSGEDYAFSCASDNNDNVFITGITTSTSNFASGGFQNTVFSTSPEVAFLVKFNAVSGTRLWATYYGPPAATPEYAILAAGGGQVCTDAGGNVYMVGYTTASGISSGGFQNTLGGGRDAFLVKFNTAGARLWATYYGGSSDEHGRSIHADASGNVYMAGQTASNNGIASGGFQATHAGNTDAFLVKFDAVGNRLWGTYYGGNQLEEGWRAVSDAGNNVYLMGNTRSATGIASGGFQNTYGGGGNPDGFVVKFNAAGNRLWGTYYGGTSGEMITDGAADGAGNLVVTGLSFPVGLPASGGFQNTPGGNLDALMVKFDPAGNRLWSSYFGGPGPESGGWGCAVDALGNIYMVGETSSATGITIPGTHQPLYGGNTDGYLLKVGEVNLITGTNIIGSPFCPGATLSVPYTLSGIYNAVNVFTAQLSDASGSFASPVTIGSVAGTTAGSISATIPAGTPPGTGYRIRVVSSSPVIVAPNNGTDLVVAGAGAATTDTDTICSNLLPYTWHGIVVPAGGIAVASDTLTNAGGCDSIVLLNLVVNPAAAPQTVLDTLCRNNFPYTWNGMTINAPAGNTATATYTGQTAGGCDSIVTLQLYVRDTAAHTDSRIYCRSDLPVLWNGITIPVTATTNAAYTTYTTATAGGCDSVVTLSLTVSDTFALTVLDTLCRNELPITWNGIVVNAPPGNTATVIYSASSAGGCDSTVTLQLYVKDTTAATVQVTICANQLPYLWNGITIPIGGPAAAVYTTSNAAGCDSTVTLNLSVNNTTTLTETISICNNQLPYLWNGITVAAGGPAAATYTGLNAAGCDSIVTLNLNVSDTFASVDNVTICATALPYAWNGISVTSGGPGAATYTGLNAAGCDSVVILNLTVTPALMPAVSITASPGTTVAPGTPVTFTATVTNGGTAPVFQWKKNGANVGSNSATYIDFSVSTADVITCMLHSDIACAAIDSALSNELTITVTIPPPPCLAPVSLISTDIQFTSATFRWADVAGASGYEFVLDMLPGDPSSGLFITDTVYHASALLPGVYYFHIRSRCPDGVYSPWIVIKIVIQDMTSTGQLQGSDNGIGLYPNPNSGTFHITGTVQKNKADIDIVDKAGRRIYQSQATAAGGKLHHRVDLPEGMAQGIYLLRVRSGNEVYVIKFVRH
jgi:hypothetical protein